ncbi:methylated-DNA--[protein]-cysteine S-methyltransferase [Microlunatus soli]|uniref:Methylated-DNA-[protein]-cysteine S-methyltransferase n=1 Tax=Microlunatus soli TaxID=630515 RepID=A0A1H1Y448_9ACTN|nr:methylated-DNA--[protein]-cysteine S-methyltransferase [Microlunatus soli]SDT16194.1 methylated-DNA-[protein]-cysteine S-methyltransferase [Microlunatus soli]
MINFGVTDSVGGRFGYLWATADVLSESVVVLGSGWTEDRNELLALLHPSLRGEPVDKINTGNSEIIDRAVRRYSDGELSAIDEIAVRQRSGSFIESAWDALRVIPPGSPATYTDLAARAGRPDAVRAAAAACAYNAAALFVPCHRVLRRDGGLGGFRYGLDVKRILRAHEGCPSGLR